MHKDDGREDALEHSMDTLGIDIAKAKYVVSLLTAERKRRHKRFPNSRDGHAALLAWLDRYATGPVHACLEATGTYGEAVATALYDAGHRVSLVNPAAIKAFAQSQLRRTKTDGLNADVQADFCAAQRPPAWTPWPAEVRELQGLVRRREAIVEMLTQERNRAQAGGLTPAVVASLARHIRMLEQELADLDRQIDHHVNTHPSLRDQRDLLITIPGIGATTAARLLAECRSIRDFDSARAYAAFAGLVPCDRQSGTLHGRPRLSKIGSARLRLALYWPAITAMRCNPILKAFAARLEANGKHKMVVVAAVMRKLLHVAYGVLTHRHAFDPAYGA